jgi:hypothetical protein
VSEPDQFGFGIRGTGRRFIDGVLQQFRTDASGNLLVDIESDADFLEMAVGSTQEPDGCTIAAALRGSLTSSDPRGGTQFTAHFSDYHVAQHPEAAALLLELNGTVGIDCLGHVTLSTVEPLRVAPGDTCLTGGHIEVQFGEDDVVAATFTESGEVDLDFGADGGIDQHFATCVELSADKCSARVVPLCGACPASNECQPGLACVPCARNCSGNTRRCSLSDAFVTCEDGLF